MNLTNEHELDQDLLKKSLEGIIGLLKNEKKDKQKVKRIIDRCKHNLKLLDKVKFNDLQYDLKKTKRSLEWSEFYREYIEERFAELHNKACDYADENQLPEGVTIGTEIVKIKGKKYAFPKIIDEDPFKDEIEYLNKKYETTRKTER